MKKIMIFILLLLTAVTFSYAERIKIEGSTTVLPIAQRAAEQFMELHEDANISVKGGGSGVGIAALIDGVCDIADASRAIKQEELDKAVSKGKDPKAHMIAMDGICVIVHPSNNIQQLTRAQLKDIFTGKIKNWSEVGGIPEKIVAISRDSSSGTYEAFGELALNKAKVRTDALMQASNQAVATTVAQTPSSIGYVGLGFVTPSVKAVIIDDITPTKETVISAKYPLARPLYMYTNGAPSGQIKDFFDYLKGEEGSKIIEEEGYIPLK
ncbi:MAG: phosphate ABC transporter substrate-binding protein [Candidatus Aureabacteria bacterium]|nr:phosphate ABC transporter substrate-binding protein [Candidatus Auribacterota bacterium]